ncbi:HDIG domain-containing protein [Puteibacter caeruleilacunae]|nr:HDIG domain-containing protein [Puteibacter caeruleilacunae]
MSTNPVEIIQKYYPKTEKAYGILMRHSELVTQKALEIAHRLRDLNPNIQFIQEAAMLHDIGIFKTDAADLGCYGDASYICHGYLGRELLEQEGLHQHALVCERHTGAGLSLDDIMLQDLPIPVRDMLPLTLEEQIICFADKFFSKGGDINKEKSVEKVRNSMARHGKHQVIRFDEWCELFL